MVREVLSKMDSTTRTINIFKRSEGMDKKAAELEAAIEKLNELRKQFGQVVKNRQAIQHALIDLANSFNKNWMNKFHCTTTLLDRGHWRLLMCKFTC